MSFKKSSKSHSHFSQVRSPEIARECLFLGQILQDVDYGLICRAFGEKTTAPQLLTENSVNGKIRIDAILLGGQ